MALMGLLRWEVRLGMGDTLSLPETEEYMILI
jgi:hypothetical protein